MKIINLGILAHVDAGKTTTVEQLLYQCGEIKQVGSIEKGNTQTDWLPIERERGISVRSASTILHYDDVQIHVIDTPGHADFTGEVERAIVAIDSAVLIVSALEGIQSQTIIFWKALQKYRIPTVIFVNKIDRSGCDLKSTLAAIEKELTPNYIPLNAVTQAGDKACRIQPGRFTENDLFILSEQDDAFAKRFLEGEKIPVAEVKCLIAQCTAKGDVYPLVYGAAGLGKGIDDLLEAMVAYLPKKDIVPEGAYSGTIYKIEHDVTMGKIAHVRLFAGTVQNRDLIQISRQEMAPIFQKVTQIRRVIGQKQEDVGVVRGGEIAALFGLSDAKTGDWIGEILDKQSYNMAVPLFSVQILLKNGEESRITELFQAVQALSDEDPLLDLNWNKDEKELIIKVMGTIQLEVLSYLLKERYNLEVTYTAPTVIYHETPIKKGIGFESYTMPKPCWAIVELEIAPLPRGSGLHFESLVKESDIFIRYQNHVRMSVDETLKQGLYGWETTDLSVKLIGGEHHLLHTHPMDFFLATPIAVMNGLTNCGTQLLEPMLKLEITADEMYVGKVIGDIISMRGTFDSPLILGGRFRIDAEVPVATSMNYPIQLSSLTGGKGTIRKQFGGYKECPPDFNMTTKRRGVDPRDRAKWILYMRNALG